MKEYLFQDTVVKMLLFLSRDLTKMSGKNSGECKFLGNEGPSGLEYPKTCLKDDFPPANFQKLGMSICLLSLVLRK